MTNENEKATARPWHLSHELGDGFSVAHEIAPNCGKLKCVATTHYHGGSQSTAISRDEAKANNALIVQAVNEYEALLEVERAALMYRSHNLDKSRCGVVGSMVESTSRLHSALANLAAIRKGEK